MPKQVRIIRQCYGLNTPSHGAEKVCELNPGIELLLLRDDERDFYKVAHEGRPIYVPKNSAIRPGETEPTGPAPEIPEPGEVAAASNADAAPQVPQRKGPLTRRVKITATCLALAEPHFEAATFSELQSGAELQLLGEEGDFYKVALLGRPAYVVRQYAAPIVEEPSPIAEPAGTSPPNWAGAATAGDADLASFGTRLAGHIVDIVLVNVGALAIGFALGLIVALALGPAATQEEADQATTTITASVTLVGLALTIVYWVWGVASGGTPGQRICGLRIVRADDDTSNPSVGQAIVRLIVAIASGLAILLGYLWAAWDEEKQTWHDKAAGTIVIKAR